MISGLADLCLFQPKRFYGFTIEQRKETDRGQVININLVSVSFCLPLNTFYFKSQHRRKEESAGGLPHFNACAYFIFS